MVSELLTNLLPFAPGGVAASWSLTSRTVPEGGPLDFDVDTVKGLMSPRLPVKDAANLAERLVNPDSLGFMLERDKRKTVREKLWLNEFTPIETILRVGGWETSAARASVAARADRDPSPVVRELLEASGGQCTNVKALLDSGMPVDDILALTSYHLGGAGLTWEEHSSVVSALVEGEGHALSGITDPEITKNLMLQSLRYCGQSLTDTLRNCACDGVVPEWFDLPDRTASYTIPFGWAGLYTFKGSDSGRVSRGLIRNLMRLPDFAAPIIELSLESVFAADYHVVSVAVSRGRYVFADGVTWGSMFDEVLSGGSSLPVGQAFTALEGLCDDLEAARAAQAKLPDAVADMVAEGTHSLEHVEVDFDVVSQKAIANCLLDRGWVPSEDLWEETVDFFSALPTLDMEYAHRSRKHTQFCVAVLSS